MTCTKLNVYRYYYNNNSQKGHWQKDYRLQNRLAIALLKKIEIFYLLSSVHILRFDGYNGHAINNQNDALYEREYSTSRSYEVYS